MYGRMRGMGRVRAVTPAGEATGDGTAEEDAVYTLEMSARRQEGFLSLMDRTP